MPPVTERCATLRPWPPRPDFPALARTLHELRSRAWLAESLAPLSLAGPDLAVLLESLRGMF